MVERIKEVWKKYSLQAAAINSILHEKDKRAKGQKYRTYQRTTK